ncbi:MAG: nucleotidyltransferase domain-containing protein [Sideroxydans sp.]|nr:nucleotidyltransferase domain-containing protein [Sideroxydans sp.]
MTAQTMPPIDLNPRDWEIVRAILARHVPQYEVWAFGSRTKGTAKEYSDLDLAIITDQPISLALSAAIADDFAESDLPIKVDVVDWATTSETFRRIIEKEKLVIQPTVADSL